MNPCNYFLISLMMYLNKSEKIYIVKYIIDVILIIYHFSVKILCLYQIKLLKLKERINDPIYIKKVTWWEAGLGFVSSQTPG